MDISNISYQVLVFNEFNKFFAQKNGEVEMNNYTKINILNVFCQLYPSHTMFDEGVRSVVEDLGDVLTVSPASTRHPLVGINVPVGKSLFTCQFKIIIWFILRQNEHLFVCYFLLLSFPKRTKSVLMLDTVVWLSIFELHNNLCIPSVLVR